MDPHATRPRALFAPLKSHFLPLLALFGGDLLPLGAPALGGSSAKQTLVLGSTGEFESLHPLISSSAQASYIHRTTSPPLVYMDENWQWTCLLCEQLPTIQNGLATIIDEGGKKRIKSRWTIKQGFTWSDGKPLVAKDFKLGFEIGISPNVLIPGRSSFDVLERVELDPQNPQSFTVISKEVDYRFNALQELTPLPEHLEGPIWEKSKNTAGAYEKASLYTIKPTTPGLHYGAYGVHEVKLGSHVTLQKNTHWTQGGPHFPTVIMKLVPNNQVLDAALVTGQVDMIAEIGTSMDQCLSFEEKLKNDSSLAQKFQLLYKEGILLGQITLNLDHPNLSDKRVRQAIQMGFDRQKLIDALFKGKVTISHQFFSPKDSLFDSQLPPITYQPQEAEKLLDEAQWKKNASGMRFKDGKPLQIQLLAATGHKSLEVAQQFIQAELRKIGIEVTLKTEPARVYFGETLNKRSFQGLALFSWISNPFDIPSSLFLSKSIPTKDNSWSGQNVGGWNNPQVDDLLNKAALELDAGKRQALMAAFNKIYRDEVPQIPLYHRPDCAIIPRALGGFKLYGTLTKSNFSMHQWVWNSTPPGAP